MLRTRFVRLSVCCACLAGVWMVLLPRVQQTKAYQARQQLFRERQIDPSAMFYTELDCLDAALDRTRNRFRWRVPPQESLNAQPQAPATTRVASEREADPVDACRDTISNRSQRDQ